MISSFSSTWKKTKQKKTPVSRGPFGASLRVVAAVGSRGNSPRLRYRYGGTQTVRAIFPDRPADARRGTKGNQKPKPSPLRGGFLKLPAMREEAYWSIPAKIPDQGQDGHHRGQENYQHELIAGKGAHRSGVPRGCPGQRPCAGRGRPVRRIFPSRHRKCGFPKWR